MSRLKRSWVQRSRNQDHSIWEHARLRPLAVCPCLERACTGTLIVRIDISGVDGSVTGLDWLADTLVEVPNHDRAAAEAWLEGRVLPRLRALVQHELRDSLLAATFPLPRGGAKGDSSITLPIVFE